MTPARWNLAGRGRSLAEFRGVRRASEPVFRVGSSCVRESVRGTAGVFPFSVFRVPFWRFRFSPLQGSAVGRRLSAVDSLPTADVLYSVGFSLVVVCAV